MAPTNAWRLPTLTVIALFAIALLVSSETILTASTTAAAGKVNEKEQAATNVPLAVTGLTSQNVGGTAGKASSGDTIGVTFNQALDSSSIPATGTITLTGASSKTTITITSLTASAGFPISGTNYEKSGDTSSATVSFSLSNGNKTVTATISGTFTNPTDVEAGSAETFTFTPATTITDSNGTAASSSYTTPSALQLF